MALLIESEQVYETRRATGADLAALHDLWTRAGLPSKELQPRFAEFYIATKGELICGTVGLQIVKQQALIHSEAYVHPRAVELLRSILWERLLNVAQNRGAARLWVNRHIQDYERRGFVPPDEESRWYFPDEFGVVSERWRVRKLKDETSEVVGELFELEAQANKEIRKNQRWMTVVSGAACMITLVCLIAFTLFLFLLGRR